MRFLTTLTNLAKSDYGLWIFLASALVAQAVFIYLVANGILFENLYVMGRFYILLILAISFTIFREGPRGVWELIRPMLNWRVSIGWYLFAIFWLVIFAIGILFFKNMIIGDAFKAIPLTFSAFNTPGIYWVVPLNAIIEEIVWVGLVLTLLQNRYSVFISSQILGFFWFLWWVPVVLYGRAVIPDLPIPVLFFHYFGIAATCAWVYYFTKSGLVVALMQMLTNVVSLIVPILPHLSDIQTYIAFVIGKLVFVVLLFVIFGPKPFFKKVAVMRQQT